MADRDLVVELDRSRGHGPQILEVARLETFVRPGTGLPRVAVEVLGAVEPGAHTIVIPTDRHRRRSQRPQPADHQIRRGAVAHGVAQEHDPIVPLAADVAEDTAQGLPVAVNIADDQVTHGVPFITVTMRRAASRGDSEPARSIVQLAWT